MGKGDGVKLEKGCAMSISFQLTRKDGPRGREKKESGGRNDAVRTWNKGVRLENK